MLIYIAIGLLVLFPVFLKIKKQEVNFFIVFVLCFLGLLRGQTVGTDVEIYCHNIVHTTFDPATWNYETTFEDGFNILIAIYNLFSEKPLFFIGLCNVFFVLSFYKYVRHSVTDTSLSFFILYYLGYYIQSYNIIRQFFAISIVLLLFNKYDIEKLNKKNIIIISLWIIFLGVFFHNSIYILLIFIVYYIIKDTKFNSKYIYYLLLVGSFTLFNSDIIRGFLSNSIGIFLINDKITSYYNAALTIGMSEYSLVRVFLDTLFYLFIVYKSCNINIYVFFVVVAQIFINLFSPLNTLFARVPIILFIISIPLIVRIWRANGVMTKLIIFIYLLLILTNIIIKNYANVQPYVLCF